MMMQANWLRVLALSVSGALLIAGCSGNPNQGASPTTAAGGGEPGQGNQEEDWAEPTEFNGAFVPDGTKSANGQVVKDIKTDAMPTDGFLVQDHTLQSNVQRVFLQQCLKDSGVDLPKPNLVSGTQAMPTEEFRNPFTGAFIFNESSAAKHGYQEVHSYSLNAAEIQNGEDPFIGALQQYLADVPLPDLTSGSEDQASEQLHPKYKQIQDCEQQLQAKFPTPGAFWKGDKPPSVEELKRDPDQIASHFSVVETPLIKEKAKAWKTCMQPLGIPDLPESPELMPPDSKGREWNPEIYALDEGEHSSTSVTNADGSPIDRPQGPSEDEKAIAVKDAQCRESSGYARALYDTRWGLVEEHLKAYEKELKDHANTIKDRERKMREYIESQK